jgi:DNA-directed RNA polymerase subunit N (RpoN/RPB10)
MESMRERYRKILIHKTPEEKRQILDSLPTVRHCLRSMTLVYVCITQIYLGLVRKTR